MTSLPLAARLAPLDDEIDAAEMVRRIEASTLNAAIDWNEGDAEVQRGLERLQRMEVPEYYLDAKRKSFGKVAYITITDDGWPGETAWFYASPIDRELGECYDLTSGPPINVAFLIHVAANLSKQLGFEFALSTDVTWGVEIQSEPHEGDPAKYIREHLPEHNYPQVSLSELADWQSSLVRAIPLWFEQAGVRKKDEMIERVGSIEAIARETVKTLTTIAAVHKG